MPSIKNYIPKQKTAYEMLSGDWSSDVCSSDLKQIAYNKANGIVPKTIIKSVRDLIEISAAPESGAKAKGVKMTERERKELIQELESKMRKAAQMLEYEIAAQLRDEIIRLRGEN